MQGLPLQLHFALPIHLSWYREGSSRIFCIQLIVRQGNFQQLRRLPSAPSPTKCSRRPHSAPRCFSHSRMESMSWLWKPSFLISGSQALSLKCIGRSPLRGTDYRGFFGALPSFVRGIPFSTGSTVSGTRDLPSSQREYFLGNRAISQRSSVMDVEAELPLAKKKCTPCSSKELQAMTKESAESLLEQVSGWGLQEVNGQLQLEKSWKVKNFVKGLEFIKSIGDVAESEGHHPDLHLVNWNDVKANIWTHSIGGLTENDFILAAKINIINTEGFLRKSLKKLQPSHPQ